MDDYEIEALRQKDSEELTNEELLQVLDRDIESNGVPSGDDLEGNDEWHVKRYVLESRFGCQNNALWRLGLEPNQEKIVKNKENSETSSEDERTELAQHELRGFEHEYDRPPKPSELQQIYSGGVEKFREIAGLPYRNLKPGKRFMTPEREDELVEDLVVRQRDPQVMDIYGEATLDEINSIIEAYGPWMDNYREIEPNEGEYVSDDLLTNE